MCSSYSFSHQRYTKSILCAKHNSTGIQDARPHFWRSPMHLASLCSWYIALMRGTWLFGIIRPRWSLFCLFNPKSALWWWCIVDTHGLPCTLTLLFAHCASWHFRDLFFWNDFIPFKSIFFIEDLVTTSALSVFIPKHLYFMLFLERWFHQSFVIPGWIGVFSQTSEEMIGFDFHWC